MRSVLPASVLLDFKVSIFMLKVAMKHLLLRLQLPVMSEIRTWPIGLEFSDVRYTQRHPATLGPTPMATPGPMTTLSATPWLSTPL